MRILHCLALSKYLCWFISVYGKKRFYFKNARQCRKCMHKGMWQIGFSIVLIIIWFIEYCVWDQNKSTFLGQNWTRHWTNPCGIKNNPFTIHFMTSFVDDPRPKKTNLILLHVSTAEACAAFVRTQTCASSPPSAPSSTPLSSRGIYSDHLPPFKEFIRDLDLSLLKEVKYLFLGHF